ncbi:MAG: hypothetical protein IJL53_05665 [Firmicutes bacterium]|nr:hypothetical protein [Bacillota bacterium]
MSFLTEKGEAGRMQISSQALQDLLLEGYMSDLFSPYITGKKFDWTKYLTVNPDDIRYRREVLKVLADNPDLIRKMTELTATLQLITQVKDEQPGEYGAESFREFGILQEAFNRMSVMKQSLEAVKAQGTLPEGLERLLTELTEKLSANYREDFEKQWNTRTTGIERIGSFSVRFNLDEEMHVTEVALASVNLPKYGKAKLFEHSRDSRMSDKITDLAPLKEMETPAEELMEAGLKNSQRILYRLLRRLTLDLDELYQDLVFYLGTLHFCSEMADHNIRLTFPEILPQAQKAFRAKDMINPVLVKLNPGRKPVPNDAVFRDGGEIFLLTGINQGGKTTYLRTVGTLQLLFQLGWPVPAADTAISPVDRIVTVFSHEENTELEHGKLGQELETMRGGMEEATEYSLLLCNEPITGTSPMENLYLSRLVLSSCKVRKLRGIWVTHLYDLASRADAMNDEVPGSRITSMTARIIKHGDSVDATYRIEPGAPAFRSYAREVMMKETNRFHEIRENGKKAEA